MSMQDPIGDMLTRVRNALSARKPHVSMPASKQKRAIAELLKSEGYIRDFAVGVANEKQELTLDLKYTEGKPAIEEIVRVSRPGLRIYRSKDQLPRVKAGLGVAIISTSSGLMTDRKARTQGVGGELLCYIS
jgi:small subunit ribosomal protein S8